MMTPFRVVVLALFLGVGTAVMLAMHTPTPPPETGYTEAVAPSLSPAGPTSRPAAALAGGTRTVTPDGLTIIEVQEGVGRPVQTGDAVSVHYTGRLYYGGDKFDSSIDSGAPLKFTVGDRMIPGFTEGVIGLKLHGKRELVIPPELGYGPNSPTPKIPPNSTLLFDIELMSIDTPVSK